MNNNARPMLCINAVAITRLSWQTTPWTNVFVEFNLFSLKSK